MNMDARRNMKAKMVVGFFPAPVPGTAFFMYLKKIFTQ